MTAEKKEVNFFEVEFFTMNGAVVKTLPAENDVKCYAIADDLVKSLGSPYISFIIKKQI